jgi:hypothetical protein
MRSKLRLAASSLSLFTLVACQPSPSAEEVAEATAAQTEALLNDFGSAAQSLNDMSSLSAMSKSASALTTTFDALPLGAGFAGNLTEGFARLQAGFSTGTQSQAVETSSTTTAPSEADIQRSTAAFAKFMRERIFTRENLESQSGDSSIFLLNGDDLCSDGTTLADAACVKAVDDIGVRVRARRIAEKEMDLTLLIGAQKHEPLELRIRRASLAVLVDFKGLKDAVESIDSVLGSKSGLPRVMDGEISYTLEKHGEKDFSFTWSVVRAINVEGEDVLGVTRTFTSGATERLFYARFNGLTKTLSAETNVGPTEIGLPYKPDISTSGLAGTRVSAHFGGASWAFEATEGQPEFTLADVGLGATTTSLKLDNHELFALDLNAASGRQFDVTLSSDTDGLAIFKVSPGYELKLKYALAPLKVDADMTVEPHFEDQTYTIALSGTDPTLKPLEANTTGFAGGIKVVSGTLTLSTSASGVEAISVPAGMCLTSKTLTNSTDHAILGRLASVACP